MRRKQGGLPLGGREGGAANVGCWRDRMKAMILSKDRNSSAAMAAAWRRGSVGTLTLRLPVVSVGKGSRGTAFGIGGDRCHGLAKGSNVDRVVEGISGIDRAGARRQAAGNSFGGTHEPTNGFKMTEVGEGDRF